MREKAAAVKVQALSALLEEKRRKREELARATGTGSTPQTPITAPSPAIPGSTTVIASTTPLAPPSAAPPVAALAEAVTQ